jgi:hypothetical protein
MTFEFDKGVTIPTSFERGGVNMDMLKAMAIGDSVWWPASDYKKATRFYRVAKRLGIPIVVRKVGATDTRGAGVRMWRVEAKDATPDAIANSEAKALAKAAQATQPPAAKKAAPKAAKKAAAVKDSGLQPAKPKRDRSKDKPRKPKPKAEIPSTPAYRARKAAEAAAAAK